MKVVIIFLTLASTFAISGCASPPRYHVQFDSQPQVAKLICNGNDYGFMPVDLYYEVDARKVETINIGDCSANWGSGASAKYNNLLDIKKFPSGIKITANRPQDIPGYKEDAQFAADALLLKAQLLLPGMMMQQQQMQQQQMYEQQMYEQQMQQRTQQQQMQRNEDLLRQAEQDMLQQRTKRMLRDHGY